MMKSLMLPAPKRSGPPPIIHPSTTTTTTLATTSNRPTSAKSTPAKPPKHLPSYEERVSSARTASTPGTSTSKPKPLFVPRALTDFGEGGSYPEIHVAQYPLNIGNPHLQSRGSNALVIKNVVAGSAGVIGASLSSSTQILNPDIDVDGKVRYDAIVKQGTNSNKIVQSRYSDLKGHIPEPETLALPTPDEEEKAAQETMRALSLKINAQVAALRPTGSAITHAETSRNQLSKTEFIRYTPDPNAPGYNAESVGKTRGVSSARTASTPGPSSSSKPKPLFVPRALSDFGEGGSYPEIHVAQYPLNIGNPHLQSRGSNALVVKNVVAGSAGVIGASLSSSTQILNPDIDVDGKVRYDAIVKQGTNSNKIVQSRYSDLKGHIPEPETLALPTPDEEEKAAQETMRALSLKINAQVAALRPTGSAITHAETSRNQLSKTEFIRYTPDPNAPGYNAESVGKTRVIQMVPKQLDPMQPAKHMHRKAPRGPADDPVPILHAPPKKLSKEESDAWIIPACLMARTASTPGPSSSSKPKPLFVPRALSDFGEGGSYPEIHVAQYPLNIGNPHLQSRGSNALVVKNVVAGSAGVIGASLSSSTQILNPDIDVDGKVRYDAIVKQGTNSNKIVQSRYSDLKGHIPEPETLALPTPDEEDAAAQETMRALSLKINAQVAALRPTGSAITHAETSRNQIAKTEKINAQVAALRPTGSAITHAETSRNQLSKTEFIRYTPDPNAPGYNAESVGKTRVIQMVPKQLDPMQPAKHMHRKAPRGPADDPVPILHAPPKKLSKEESDAWIIPACISNWKNTRGYTIPLDKRLAADGRGLREHTVNEQFATLSESLYVAERAAREEVRMRAAVQRRLVEGE
eukprot:CAMPEP_0194393964 /NCGR_PEP_ID=MMETSP0174-20130528/123589_1 /TAXON_ID=216777 /ORGANISM="Proboscia alata, Strain PI-D3" /LENGTH=862 /DNA_ID=CAMNT_0039189705 /DNA_START=150 /DNA_END=2736 /DNA_ORIENTATION=+